MTKKAIDVRKLPPASLFGPESEGGGRRLAYTMTLSSLAAAKGEGKGFLDENRGGLVDIIEETWSGARMVNSRKLRSLRGKRS
jgi:hypothetical protein